MSPETQESPNALAGSWNALRELATGLVDTFGVSAEMAANLARETRRGLYRHGLSRCFEWSAAGVQVERRRLATSGMLVSERFPIRVWINAQDDPRRQRFTVAHELAHYLLGRRPAVSPAALEAVCDAYASELLVPAAEVRARLTADGAFGRAADVVTLAHECQASLSTVVRQISKVAWCGDSFILLCKQGPGGQRVAFAAGGEIGHPPLHQRLSSLGAWKACRVDGAETSGVARLSYRFLGARLPGSLRKSSGNISGIAKWDSISLTGGTSVVVVRFLRVASVIHSIPRGGKAAAA